MAATALSGVPSAKAWIHGKAPVGKVVINGFQHPDHPFKNLVLNATVGFSQSSWSSLTTNATGYPTSNAFSAGNLNLYLPSNYFGKYRIRWDGNCRLDTGQPITVYVNPNTNVSGGVFQGSFIGATDYVEFDFSVGVASVSDSGVSNGAGGTLVQITTSSALNSVSPAIFKSIGVGGGVADQVWSYTRISSTQYNLLGSTFSSTAGAGGTVVFAPFNPTWSFKNSGTGSTYTSFANLILCMSGTASTGVDHSGDLTDVLSGTLSLMFNQDFINVWSAMGPAIYRFLDATNMNGCTNTRAAYTTPVGFMCYGSYRYLPRIWSGAIASAAGAGVVYTCAANPDTPVSLTDGEIAQGVLSEVPTTTAVTGAASGTGGVIRLTVVSSAAFSNGQRVAVEGYNGASGYAAGNGTGTWTITVVDGTHIELTTNKAGNPSVFVNAWVSGGKISAATLDVGSRGAKLIVNPEGLAPAYDGINSFVTNAPTQFVYNSTLDAWIAFATSSNGVGLTNAWPLEVQVALCNKLQSSYWHQFPHLYDLASVATDTAYIKNNLSSRLDGYFERSNELWNNGFTQTALYYTLSTCLDASSAAFGQSSYVGLQHRLTMQQVTTSWGGRGGLNRVLPWQAADNCSSNTINLIYNGSHLNGATYPLYAAAGYSNYNTAPLRPIDATDCLSYAPYYSGAVLGPRSLGSSLSAIDLNGITGAADAYASGDTATAYAWFDNDIRQGSRNTKAIASVSGGATFNITSHGYPNGTLMTFSLASGGTFYSAGASLTTPYYVVNTAANSFQLSLTSGGSAITGVTGGSGVQIGISGAETLATINTNSASKGYYSGWAAAAVLYNPPKRIVCYEGGYQGGPGISTADCTANGISTDYGGTVSANSYAWGGKIYDALLGYKNSALFQATVAKQFTDQLAYYAKTTPAWYTSSGANGATIVTGATTAFAASYTWAMTETDLYGTPQMFKSYDAFKAFNQ